MVLCMNKKFINILICSLIGLFVGSTILLYGPFKDQIFLRIFHILELQSINKRINLSYDLVKKKIEYPRTIVLHIDGSTKETLPQWFDGQVLKRDIYAKLIHKLNALGVKTIGIDVLFFADIDPEDKKNTALVAAINKYKNVILTSEIDYRKNIEANELKTSFNDLFPDSYYGVVNVSRDRDQFIRRFFYSYPFKGFNFETMQEENQHLPSFAVAVINKYKPGLISKKVINSDSNNNYYINYFNTDKPVIKRAIYEIIDDDADQVLKSIDFKDSIVLIGNSLKSAHDYFEVPLKSKSSNKQFSNEFNMPGVDVQANIIDTILNQQVITNFDVKWNSLIVILLCIFCGFILGTNRGFLVSICSIMGTVTVYILFTLFMYSYYNLIVTMVFPIFQFLVVGALCWGFLFVFENKQKMYIFNSFKKYVSPEVARIASDNIDNLKATRKEVTILFSDIAGFTTITEQTDPESLSHMLNQYFSCMGKIIFKYNGTLDKYIGDAVMAFWGAPMMVEDHGYKACLAALEMQKEIALLNKEFEKQDLPSFIVRIGLNSDKVMVGNLGGDLFNYTAIGDGVNLASRLEGANKNYNTSIIISEFTHYKVKDQVVCREIGDIIVKGKTESVVIYELVGIKSELTTEKLQEIDFFNDGVRHYKNNNFSKAREIFSQILENNPKDLVSQAYLDKINEIKPQ